MRKPDTFTLLGGLLILVAAGTYVTSYLGSARDKPVREPGQPEKVPAKAGFDPLSPAAHWALAERLEKAGQKEEAERLRRAARRLGGEDVPEPGPASAPPAEETANLLLVPGSERVAAALETAAKGDLDGAIESLRGLIAEEGETHINQTALGFIHSYRAEPAEADRALSRAIEIDGTYAPAHFGRGVVRLRSHRYRDAAQDLETACRLTPDALPWRIELATALRGTGRTDDALKQLEFVLRRRPGTPDVYRSVGDCLLRGGREEEARRWYRAAILLGGPDHFPEELRRFAEGIPTEGS